MATDKRMTNSTNSPRGNVNGMNPTNPPVFNQGSAQQPMRVTQVAPRATFTVPGGAKK